MEKPTHKSHENQEVFLSPESRSSISGVFERADAILAEPSYDNPKKSVGRILESFKLPKNETETLANGVIAKLKELDEQESALRQEAKSTLLGKIRNWAKQNKFTASLLVAGALHSPVIARTAGFADQIKQVLDTVKDWEKPGAVIRPQSEADRQSVIDQIHERGERVDQNKKSALLNELRAKMESGEKVKLNETFLKLEEVHGVEPERVKIAERKKQEMIERFASRMGDDLSEDFIRSVVDEMFGSNDNYVWGQASVTEYFVTGKRNCASITRAEQMVFEALIDRLPAEKSSKYKLGTAFEKQHEIAILKVLNSDGGIDKTYFLQPPVDVLQGKADRPGSPTISLKAMQSAMVSKTTVTISSNTKPGEIPPSPDLDIITNQPVPLNINIRGDLRSSNYNERIVEERGIEIQWKEPSTTDEIMDLEIIQNDDAEKAKQKINEAYKFIESNNPECEDANNYPTNEEIDKAIPYTAIDLSSVDWNNLDGKEIDAILQELLKVRELPRPDAVKYGDINSVPESVFLNFLPNPSPSNEMVFSLKADSSGTLDMEKTYQLIDRYNSAIKLVESVDDAQKRNIPKIHFQYGEDIHEGALVEILKSLEGGELMLDQKNTIARGQYSDKIVNAMTDSKVNDLYLEGADLTPEALQVIISHPNKTYHFGLTAYMEILMKRPDVASAPHIKPWVDKLISSAELDYRNKQMSPEQKAVIAPIMEKLEEESIHKFYRSHQ